MSQPEFPPRWRKGELLDVRRYTDGTCKVSALSDEAQKPEALEFASIDGCQAFVSAWYQPEQGR